MSLTVSVGVNVARAEAAAGASAGVGASSVAGDGPASLLDTTVANFTSAAVAKKLAKLGLETGWDLVYHLPRRWFKRGEMTPLGEVSLGQHVTIAGIVTRVEAVNRYSGPARVSATISDGHRSIIATFFARKPYLYSYYQKRLAEGEWVIMSGKASEYRGRVQLTHPDFLDLDPEDPQTAQIINSPIPVYRASAQLPSWKIATVIKTLLAMASPSDLPDLIPAQARTRLGLMTRFDALRALHDPGPDTDIERAVRTIRAEEAFLLNTVLARGRHDNATKGSYSLPGPGPELEQVIQRLPFTLRTDQRQVLDQILTKFCGPKPAQILLQADVGAGKTIIAALSALHAVLSGYQAIILAPTEVLARQHGQSLTRLLGREIPILTASTPRPHRRALEERLSAGEPLLIVGTHAVLNLEAPNLACVVIDEQHRFGVAQRDRLRQLNERIAHMLVMTATPIPRSIAMTVFGDLEPLIMPGGGARTGAVTTHIAPTWKQGWVARTWARVAEEVAAGGRVFVVVARINEDDKSDLASLEAAHNHLQRVVDPQLIAQVHGRMSGAEKTAALESFTQGTTPVLVATTVIEVGIDVGTATMMVIVDAHQFGLAQLHQLRGRIGRAGLPGLCIAITSAPPDSEAMARLEAFATIDDGFALAEADLELRDAGDVTGENQSGSSQLLIDVLGERELIEATRPVAESVINSDPDLTQHQALKDHLARRLSEDQRQSLGQG